MIMPINAKNTFNKIKHPFMIKNLGELGIEGSSLNLIKNIYKKLQLTLYLMVRKLKLSHSDQVKARMSSCSTPVQHCTGSPC